MAACSSDSSTTNPPADTGTISDTGSITDTGSVVDTGVADTGTTADASEAGEAAAATANEQGTVAAYPGGAAVANATVTIGALTATSDSSGKYTLAVPIGTPFSHLVTADKYTKSYFAERIMTGDFAEIESIPLQATFDIGKGALAGYDATKAVVYVIVQPTGSCTDVSGGTLTVNAPSGTTTVYFSGYLPSTSQTSFQKPPKPLTPVAVVYNVPPGSKLDLSIAHPNCTMVPMPATVGNVTYTGNVPTEAGEANSSTFYFLK
jgi:hypothetical protein